MHDALAHLDKVQAELQEEQKRAIDLQIEARNELNRIKSEAESLSAEYISQHQHAYDERLRFKTLTDIVIRLLQSGKSAKEIKDWLGIDDLVISAAMAEMGYTTVGNYKVKITYQSEGRAGYVLLFTETGIFKLPYEFGGGNTLAIIDIPETEEWESQTHIPLALRSDILEFIAQTIVNDQAPGYKYRIEEKNILITE